MKFNLVLFVSLFSGLVFNGLAQSIFHQDIINGGVSVGGFSSAQGAGSGVVTLHIEPGSLIKKAILFSYSASKASNHLIINNDSFSISQSNMIESFNLTSIYYNPISLHAIDITNWVQIQNTNIFNMEVPVQLGMPYSAVFAPFLFILYENPNLAPVAYSIILNNQDLIGSQNYQISDLLPINFNFPAGFAPYLDRVTEFRQDAENVHFMGNFIGQLCGTDSVNINFSGGGGVKGHFYYQNNQLFGLDDDTPSPNVDSTDALLDFSSYITNNSTSINFKFEHSEYPNQLSHGTNLPLAFFLAYTSPCDTFSVTHTPDTTVCHGAQVPLFASGGQSYEWSPQVGLSCYDCPNPIFSADSSRYYSLRIWNNDSCSKVLPIFIKVNPPTPNFNLEITPSECGDSTGIIKVNPILNGFTYINQTNGDTSASGVFNSLHSGNYHISVLDSFGCGLDTLIHVPETLSVHAAFTSNPNAGVSPLTVEFSNQSTGASSYQWIYDNQSSTNQDVVHTFGQDGIYPIVLYAYGNSPLCVDTAYDTIRVYLPLVVDIPNIFTPNDNSVNEQWGVKINVPAKIDVQIFNRWGEIILNNKQDATAPGFIALWDGAKHVGGVYYYVVVVETLFEKEFFRGNITLIK